MSVTSPLSLLLAPSEQSQDKFHSRRISPSLCLFLDVSEGSGWRGGEGATSVKHGEAKREVIGAAKQSRRSDD